MSINLLRERGASTSGVSRVPPSSGSFLRREFNLSKYLYYGGIFLFIVVAVIAVFHVSTIGIFTIDYSTGQLTRIPVSQTMKVPAQYPTSPIPATLSTKFSSVLQVEYTVGFDVYISDGTPVQNNYRVIFYNGAQTPDPTVASNDPSQVNNIGSALSFVVPSTLSRPPPANRSTVDPTSITSIQTALFANKSNICMYMAPDTNDVYLTYFVGHTTPSQTGPDVETLNGWAISKPIKNIPIGKPFRVTLVIDNQFIETYINGELVLTTKTYIAGHTSNLHSHSTSVNYNFYGPPDVMYLKGIKVANINYWDQILPSKSVRVFSGTPIAKSKFTS